MRNLNLAIVGLVVSLSADGASAAPVCAFGSCIDPIVDRSTSSFPDSEPRPGNSDDDAGGAPEAPQGPSNTERRRERAAVDRYAQGQRAATRGELDDAIRHFEASVRLGAGGARLGLANVQHRKAVKLFKAGRHREARRLLSQAIENDPNSELYSRKRKLMNDTWCARNKPLVPHSHRDQKDLFDETAWGIIQARVARARNDGWECEWFDSAYDW